MAAAWVSVFLIQLLQTTVPQGNMRKPHDNCPRLKEAHSAIKGSRPVCSSLWTETVSLPSQTGRWTSPLNDIKRSKELSMPWSDNVQKCPRPKQKCLPTGGSKPLTGRCRDGQPSQEPSETHSQTNVDLKGCWEMSGAWFKSPEQSPWIAHAENRA